MLTRRVPGRHDDPPVIGIGSDGLYHLMRWRQRERELEH